MSLISLVLVLAVFGLILWLINTYIPMAPPIKTIINVIAVIVLCVWLLQLVGIGDIRIPIRHP